MSHRYRRLVDAVDVGSDPDPRLVKHFLRVSKWDRGSHQCETTSKSLPDQYPCICTWCRRTTSCHLSQTAA